jgi:hypothetical protein
MVGVFKEPMRRRVPCGVELAYGIELRMSGHRVGADVEPVARKVRDSSEIRARPELMLRGELASVTPQDTHK